MYWIIQDVLRNPLIAGKYFFVGTIGAFSNIFTFYLLTHYLGYWYILSAICAACVGYVVAFLLQKYWTFADYDHKKFTRQALAYLAVTCLNLLGGVIMLTIFVEICGMGHVISQTISVCIMSVASFFINRHVTFNHNII